MYTQLLKFSWGDTSHSTEVDDALL